MFSNRHNNAIFTAPFALISGSDVLCIFVADRESQTTKTGLERVIPISDKLMPTVKRRLDVKNKGPVFPFAVKDSGSSFGRLWLKKVKSIADDLTMHGFRHYVASEMENNGVSKQNSSAILGHVENGVHENYVHV